VAVKKTGKDEARAQGGNTAYRVHPDGGANDCTAKEAQTERREKKTTGNFLKESIAFHLWGSLEEN